MTSAAQPTRPSFLRGVLLAGGAVSVPLAPILPAAATPIGWLWGVEHGDTLSSIIRRVFPSVGPSGVLLRVLWVAASTSNAHYLLPFAEVTRARFCPLGLFPVWAKDPVAALRGEPGDDFPVLWLPAVPGAELVIARLDPLKL